MISQRLVGVLLVWLGFVAVASADTLYSGSEIQEIDPDRNEVFAFSESGEQLVFASVPLELGFTTGLAFRTDGSLFTSHVNADKISRIAPDGEVSPFADLPAGSVPLGLAFDAQENLYVACASSEFAVGPSQIYKISNAGVVSNFATMGENKLTGGIAFDRSGDLFASSWDEVLRIRPDGTVREFAALPSGTRALGLAFDVQGDLLVAGFETGEILRVSPFAAVSPFAQLPPLAEPIGLAFDSAGNLYQSGADHQIRKITPQGEVSHFADAKSVVTSLAFTDDFGTPLVVPFGGFLLPGDANSDGTVDLTDFGILKVNFGSGSNLSQGDFNGDANVDLTDFGILKSNFGKQGSTNVPEPSTILLATLAGLGLVATRVRSKR